MEVIDRVKELAAEYLERHGIELIEITYKRGQGGMVLGLVADTPNGISIDECEAFNNYLSDIMDKENVIEEHYVIEVSSPGLDRPIKTDRDFERAMGKELEITTYEPIDMRKSHEGRLTGMDKEKIVIATGDISIVIPRAKIARAALKIDFK